MSTGPSQGGCLQKLSCANSLSLDRLKNPFGSVREYFKRMDQHFGKKFMVELASVYFGVKGAMNQFLGLSMLPLYKQMGLDGLKYQAASTVAMAPWAMKGLLGVLSDAVPIGGLHKRPYMLIAGCFGVTAVLLLPLLPLSLGQTIPFLFPLLFFAANLQASTMDLLCEGMYSRYMVAKPESKSDVVSFVWMSIMTGALLASCIVGPVADYLGANIVFWFCLPFAAQSLIPTFFGFLPEERVTYGICPSPVLKDENNRVLTAEEAQIWHENRRISEIQAGNAGRKGAYILAIAMAVGAMGQALCAAFAPYVATLIYCVGISSILSVMCFKFMDSTLAKCNLYLFLNDALYLSIAGALDFWYTADENCVKGGPNFSYSYYNTWTQIVGTLASLVGIWMFQTVMADWPLRRIFWVSTSLRIMASFVDLVIVKRWNVQVGIDDHWAYMLGDAIVQRICEMLNFMPAVVLTSKLCPKHIESTVFAILAGFSNFGQAVAKSAGVVAIQQFGVSTTAPSCDFDALPWLITVAHGIIPLISVPLTFVLIPEKRLSEDFVVHDDDDGQGLGGGGGEEEEEGSDEGEEDSDEYEDALGRLDGKEDEPKSEIGSMKRKKRRKKLTLLDDENNEELELLTNKPKKSRQYGASSSSVSGSAAAMLVGSKAKKYFKIGKSGDDNEDYDGLERDDGDYESAPLRSGKNKVHPSLSPPPMGNLALKSAATMKSGISSIHHFSPSNAQKKIGRLDNEEDDGGDFMGEADHNVGDDDGTGGGRGVEGVPSSSSGNGSSSVELSGGEKIEFKSGWKSDTDDKKKESFSPRSKNI